MNGPELEETSMKPVPAFAPPRTLAMVGGEDRVGCSTLAVNLALALGDFQKKVLVVEGPGNRSALGQFLDLPPLAVPAVPDAPEELLAEGPDGLHLLLNTAGTDLSALDRTPRRRWIRGLVRATARHDLVILDLAGRPSEGSGDLARRADDVLVVTTIRESSIAGARGWVETLVRAGAVPRVLVNRAQDARQAQDIYLRLSSAGSSTAPVLFAGFLPEDPQVRDAQRSRRPFVVHAPTAPSSLRVRELAWRLMGGGSPRGGDRALHPGRWTRPGVRPLAA
jgi:flagellar biosynthesis protein FlhG